MGNKQDNSKIKKCFPCLHTTGKQELLCCNDLINELRAVIKFFYIVEKYKMKFLIVVCLLVPFYSLINAQPTDSYPFQVKKGIVKRDFCFRKEVVGDYKMKNKIIVKESKRCIRNIHRHSFPHKKMTQRWLNEINKLDKKLGFTVHIAKDFASSHNYYLKLSDSIIAEISLYKVLFNQDSSNVAIAYYDYNKNKRFIAANGRIYPFDYDSEKIAMYNDDVYKLKIIYGSNDSDTSRFPYYITDSIRIYKLNECYNSLTCEKEILRFSYVKKVILPQLATPPLKKRQIPFFIHNGNFIYQRNGKVYINGELLNKKINAKSIIRYSIVKDKPAYMYYRENEWHLSFNNIDYGKLGFDEILPLNSVSYPCYTLTDLRFYARKGRKYYSVQIK